MTQYDREEEQLMRDLEEGRISAAEFNKQLSEMQRSYADELRGMAEEAAERAYRDEYERW